MAYGIPNTVDTVVLSTSLADYSKTLTDNVYNANEILKFAKSRKRLINGGLSIVYPIIKNKQDDGGFYLGADVLNNTQGNDTTLVEYRWQNAYQPIQISRDEERQNSGDQHKILDLVGTKISLAEKGMADMLEQAISTPTGDANYLNDLETIVGTGVLGSLDGSSDTYWQSTVTTSGAFATQGLTDMTTATYAVSGASAIENPTHYVTNKTIFQKFEQTRLPMERISNGDLSANAGFVNLTFKGKPLFYGNYIGSGLLFGLNANYIDFNVDTETDMITTEFLMPTNQTVKVAYVLFRGNLVTNNRRRHFKLQSIT